LIEGEKSGPSTPFDFDDFIAHKREIERGEFGPASLVRRVRIT
jgi:hypothetical protein